MATGLERTIAYNVPARALYGAYATEQYWHDRVAEVGGEKARVDKVEITATAVSAVTIQVILAESLPSVVQAFHKGDIEITRTETWGAFDAATGTASGTFSAVIDGVPARMDGKMTLSGTPDASTSSLSAKGAAEVKLPFVAGKVESVVVENLEDLFDREREFTTGWIAQHSQ